MPGNYVVVRKDVMKALYTAVVMANAVLEKERFAGMDQNPKGVRDLVGHAAIALESVNISEFM